MRTQREVRSLTADEERRLRAHIEGNALRAERTHAWHPVRAQAMIDYVNRTRNDHIITIEDPIEFVHEDINCVVSQREIGHDSPSFATALRAALRRHPAAAAELKELLSSAGALFGCLAGETIFYTGFEPGDATPGRLDAARRVRRDHALLGRRQGR